MQNPHALPADKLLPDPGTPGPLRTVDMGSCGTGCPPTTIPLLIDECFGILLDKAAAIENPFGQAFFARVQWPCLPPFEDMKRVPRRAANIPLGEANLVPPSFADVPVPAYIDGTPAVYELNRIELLRNVFAWACGCSCRRCTPIRRALPSPDPLRLRDRDAPRDGVAEIVRAGRVPTPSAIRRAAGAGLPAAEPDAFVALTIDERYRLHEGNIVRDRLRPSESEHWTLP